MVPSGLRVWLYYRLSRDDDREQDSLKNQKKIMETFAANHGHVIVGESFDDNISGVHMDTRRGIYDLLAAAERRKMDAVLVKDLSRLGRNKAETPMLIEDFRRYQVRLISVTENLDSFNPNDDLIIGIKHVINEGYAKDTSRKIQSAYHQKQQQGIVIIPPFGYVKVWEGKKYHIEVDEECADIVRLIFDLYVRGLGVNRICEYMIDRNIPSPAYFQKKHYDKNLPHNATAIAKKYMWSSRSVDVIIKNEAYNGVLVNRKSIKNTIYRTRTNVPKEEQIRHEGFYPPIIDADTYALAQETREHRNHNKVRTPRNRPIYRYAGLLRCADCGATFVAKKRDDYVQYVCNTYHRISGNYCTSHRINEPDLDDRVFAELSRITFQAHRNWTALDEQVNTWKRVENSNRKTIQSLEGEQESIRDENMGIARQMIRDKNREAMYMAMLDENEKRASDIERQIKQLRDAVQNAEESVADLHSAMEVMTKVIESREIDNGQLILLIDHIIVKDAGDGKVDIDLKLKAEYNTHSLMASGESAANSTVDSYQEPPLRLNEKD